jgi:hypothetical protein
MRESYGGRQAFCEFHDLYSISPEYFGYTLVQIKDRIWWSCWMSRCCSWQVSFIRLSPICQENVSQTSDNIPHVIPKHRYWHSTFGNSLLCNPKTKSFSLFHSVTPSELRHRRICYKPFYFLLIQHSPIRRCVINSDNIASLNK